MMHSLTLFAKIVTDLISLKTERKKLEDDTYKSIYAQEAARQRIKSYMESLPKRGSTIDLEKVRLELVHILKNYLLENKMISYQQLGGIFKSEKIKAVYKTSNIKFSYVISYISSPKGYEDICFHSGEWKEKESQEIGEINLTGLFHLE